MGIVGSVYLAGSWNLMAFDVEITIEEGNYDESLVGMKWRNVYVEENEEFSITEELKEVFNRPKTLIQSRKKGTRTCKQNFLMRWVSEQNNFKVKEKFDRHNEVLQNHTNKEANPVSHSLILFHLISFYSRASWVFFWIFSAISF